MNARLSRLLLALILFAPLIGCGGEDVTSYTAPSDADPGTGPVRVLAAIIPVGEDTWFVKLAGRNDIVEMVEPGFRSLIGSLDFPKGGDPSMKWTVPKGWKEDRTKDRSMPDRVATLTPLGVGKPEITITKLGAGAAPVKPNVDRWRRLDLGLYAITPRALEKVVREQKVGGRTITIVDLRGPGGKGMMPSPRDPREMREKRPPRTAPPKYKVPDGWKEVNPTSRIVVAAFEVSDGKEPAVLNVTPLSRPMPGGLTLNVNRWRKDDLKLPPLSAAEVEQMKFPTIQVAGLEAKMLDLEGTEKRSLIVWFERGDATWFFKLLGPKKLVGSQKSKFEEFMKSVQFSGGAE
jgi:hypothetical protein